MSDLKNILEGLFHKMKSLVVDEPVKESETPDKGEIKGDQNMGKLTFGSVFAAILNGLGVGLLLGILLGLAVSPVVSGVIGTISSLLAVLLGLNEKLISPLKGIRIGFFGIFAVAGILLGMYIRANNPLSSTLDELKQEYMDLGYTKDEALDFIAYLEFELKPEEWAGRISDSAIAPKKRSNVLYSAKVQLNSCRYIENADENMEYAAILSSFVRAGGVWKEFTGAFGPDTPDEVKTGALLAMRDTFCGYGTTGFKTVSGCEDLGDLADEKSLEEIKKKLRNSGETWKAIVSSIEQRVEENYQREILISFTNILCHE